MTRLFIENQEVELDKSVQFTITKQFEDLTNPTKIINTWSKTVSIPFTPNNNKLFGYIYNIDMVTTVGTESQNTGINFNPTKRLNFRLEYDNSVLMQGYAKMTSIKREKGNGTYELTLFGELGRIFSELKQIKFGNTNDGYEIKGSDWYREELYSRTVYDSWVKEPEMIGFLPNIFYDNYLKYDSVQIKDNKGGYIETFKNILKNTSYEDTAKVSIDSLPDNLSPRDYGEFRSYLQIPYIRFPKLLEIFKTKAESLIDYEIELDSKWFSDYNPYYSKLIYTLQRKIDSKNLNKGINKYYCAAAVTHDIPPSIIVDVNNQYRVLYDDRTNEAIPLQNNTTTAYGGNVSLQFTFSIPARIEQGVRYKRYWTSINAKIFIINSETEINYEKDVYISPTRNPTLDEQGKIWIGVNEEAIQDQPSVDEFITEGTIDLTLPLRYALYRPLVIILSIQGGQTYPIREGISSPTTVALEPLSPRSFIYTTFSIQEKVRSFSTIDLTDLWNFEYNLFDEILKYCKQYRIGVFTDTINKKIIFKPFSEYFANYKIEDWTDKIDFSKDFTIKPVTFDKKYVMFNYQDTDNYLNKTYKENIGYNFGEKRLTTEYRFNEETENLFDKTKNSITFTPNVLSWATLYESKDYTYTLPAEIYPSFQDKDGNITNTFGQYYILKGIRDFDSNYPLRYIFISEDTALQATAGEYFYLDGAYEGDGGVYPFLQRVTSYPDIDIAYTNNLISYTIPTQSFNYQYSYKDNPKGLFENFWEKYLNEKYNYQNRLLTCWVKFSPSDFINFDYTISSQNTFSLTAKFVKIQNQLYHVNKIYDYDFNQQLVKMDLVTVQDIKNYTTNNWEGYLELETTRFIKDGNYIEVEPTDLIGIQAYSDSPVKVEIHNQDYYGMLINSQAVSAWDNRYVPSTGLYIQLSNQPIGYYMLTFESDKGLSQTIGLEVTPTRRVIRLSANQNTTVDLGDEYMVRTYVDDDSYRSITIDDISLPDIPLDRKFSLFSLRTNNTPAGAYLINFVKSDNSKLYYKIIVS